MEKVAGSGAQGLPAKRSNQCLPNKTKSTSEKAKNADRAWFCRVQDAFRIAARKTSAVLGTALAFIGAIAIIVVWGLTGHIFHYSDTLTAHH